MFFALPRAAIVLAILFGLILAKRLYRQWRARVEADSRPVPRLPTQLLGGSERTWVVFTTPMCASCGPVVERLQEADPGARVVTVDATREVPLADAFRIRSAPTVLLADGAGEVQTRLVGASAVEAYVRSPA
jgi:hypothetical protein